MDGTIRGITAIIGGFFAVGGVFLHSAATTIFGVLILLYVIFSKEYNPERKD